MERGRDTQDEASSSRERETVRVYVYVCAAHEEEVEERLMPAQMGRRHERHGKRVRRKESRRA